MFSKRPLLLFTFVFALLLSLPAQAGWPDGCGHKNQNTCMGPVHHGCISSLEKCDMPHGERDVCKKPGHCPENSRNKAGCPDCGHEGQKPCIFGGICHMCVKHHHVSAKTGKCTKTHSLEGILKAANEKLSDYEDKCHKGLQKFEGNLSKDARKKLEHLLHGNQQEERLVNAAMRSTKTEKACMEETLNGASCGLIAWVKSYNNLLIYLMEGHSVDVDDLEKAVLDQSKKYMDNLLHNKICKNIADPMTRTLCASIETIVEDTRGPVECMTLTIKDASHLKKRKDKKKFSEKALMKFTKEACYQTSRLGVGVAADQAVSLLTAEIGESVELPKDVKAVITTAEKLAKAKILLEKTLDKGEKTEDLIRKSDIHSIMKKHNSCKPLLKFID